jgi:hypothetical protein
VHPSRWPWNPDKPPLYIDLAARQDGDQLIVDSKLTARLRDNFFVESWIPPYAENLKSLRGLKFDWARSDQNQDHVYSNIALTHKLNEFGIHHEAEEYNGTWGEPNWPPDGRIATEVLPFFPLSSDFRAPAPGKPVAQYGVRRPCTAPCYQKNQPHDRPF